MDREAARPKVLIVEDELAVALDLGDIIVRMGCEVVGPSGHLGQVMQLIQTCEIDAALLDIRLLKDELVFPAAELLRQRGIPFVFTTAYDRKVPRSHGFKEPTLLKPLDRSVVEKMVSYLTTAGF
jgi:two-component SAPR family response regulator